VRKLYLVDGYNVIFSSALRDLPLERARESLVRFARIYHPDEVRVVFDGKQGHPFPAETPEVVFSRDHSADDGIVHLVKKYRTAQKEVWVVTADRALADRVRALDARVMTPAAFLRGPTWMRKKARRRMRATEDPEKTLPVSEREQLMEDLRNAWIESRNKEMDHG